MKRLLAALVALMVWAATACAQVGSLSVPVAGRFVWGDDLTDLATTLSQPTGVAYDLTSADVYLIARNRTTLKTFTIQGDLVAAGSGRCKFEDVGTSFQDPGRRRVDIYDCRVKVVNQTSGEVGYSMLFRLTVEVWP